MTGTASPKVRLIRFQNRTPSETGPLTNDGANGTARSLPEPDLATIDRDALYTEFAPLVRRLTRQYGQDAEMREDLAGEIYCRFCVLLDAYDPARGVPLRPYIVRQLFLATYTYARQQWQLKKREAAWELEESRVERKAAFDPTLDWIASLAQEQASTLLPVALQNLPPRQRNVVIWRYYEERSFEEIGALLAVQPSTARSLLRHGLKNMLKFVGSQAPF